MARQEARSSRKPASRPSAPPDEVELPAELVEQLVLARNTIEQWEGVRDRARARIEALMGDSPKGIDADGEVVIVWAQEGKRRVFNRTAFAKAHPDLEAEFIELKPGNRPFKVIEKTDTGDED